MISFQTNRELINVWLSTAKSYLKNIGFDFTGIKLLNKDMFQQLKAHQEQDGGKSYVLNCVATGRIVKNEKMHQPEMLQTRMPTLENL